ncbi:MAG: multifunctional oxoglutarate decarboxylase/oxoglutarate dehydrogenase thiamine pyrophosphate-binding subunit/dihydrolipoyllysine-residue succinyltransferase subunit [Acidimicrobiia bacterium]|nr:multifunctional oxoglutarate decarboxylase/oxoglutarate dehydrogenase thiamine pyrophosphate-binding subunit/dihydrolipoyllysine-residue succinyltransferase subunit [Acidimicrobiia bacterium]
MAARDTFEDLGPNAGLVEEMYRQFVEAPESVSESWRDFFADYVPRGTGRTGAPTAGPAAVAASPPPPPPVREVLAPSAPAAPATPSPGPPAAPTPSAPARAPAPATGGGAPLTLDGEEPAQLRGAAARIVENMEASLGVPTATSVREVPAKLLEVNRQIINNQLARTGGGKVSFTHLIAYAVVRALTHVPGINSGYGVVDGRPAVVRHGQVNLGLAVDVTRPDGSRSLLVPNIKAADTLDFEQFFVAYEDLIRRVRTGKITPDDFAGTTGSITNPGMIGTVHSVPRLMPGQGFIVGVGAITHPAGLRAADPVALARLGVGKTVTLTNTYDHRIIGGAESGEFLRWVDQLLIGAEGFYDDVFHSLVIPYEPARWHPDVSPLDELEAHKKVVEVHALVNMYRVRGHLLANLDPLGRREPRTHPELDIQHYGLTIWDLDREFPTGNLAVPVDRMPLRDILGTLRDAYARTIGVEYMHIQEHDQKAWIQEHVEGGYDPVPPDVQRRILERLNAAEAFERFLHTKYLGHKRFSLEGAESLIPMLDALLDDAVGRGIEEAVLGMAHRGRLNVLANTVGKSYAQIFAEFEGAIDLESTQGSGDVKYHVGASGKHVTPDGREIRLTLASNASHLEAVDPVVSGMTRAAQDARGDRERRRVLPVLIHGDAAFAGQGVVAETFNLSEVPGYHVGGTVHIVVNNQLGFTTAPDLGRSTVYATDVAKMVQAPIFHVNGDDPEACVRVVRLAFAFREAFRKDVVVDMVCYRRYGHNEADEPAYTQPRMYALIDAHRSVRKLYTETLVNRGDIDLAEAEAALDDFRARLEAAFEETHQSHPPEPHEKVPGSADVVSPPDTSVDRAVLARIVDGLTHRPDSFHVHPKLARLLAAHGKAFEADQVDWSLAEAFAFGSMALEGTPVRVAGQDTRRGTFSQRHGVLVDFEDESEYAPLAHLSADQAPFMLYDSVLSEYAALAFEYGYSVGDPRAFVAWEAQFGDFMNGAQIVIDEFVVAAEDKWGQRSSLTLLLPHGFEGQGPDHSSARMERFLALCAEGNMRVAYPSTASQYFHVLRRQRRAARRAPLVCFTPKRYLRMAHTRSPVGDFTSGAFHLTLDDRSETLDPASVRRVLLCTGKLGHELMDHRDEVGAPAAVVRIEQLYPWPADEIAAHLARYPGSAEVWWVQEEPENMGGWNYAHGKLRRLLDDPSRLHHLGRPASASPATGSATVHDLEQAALLEAAFDGLA